MAIRIPDLLDAILEATATEQGAKARIAGLRAALEDEARRRYAEEGAAPTWKAPKLGTVRYDAPGDWTATVADPDVFGSWAAEHHPTEAIAVLRMPAADLPAALEALAFADVTTEARVELRPAWVGPFVASLAVDVEETTDPEGGGIDRQFTIVDPAAGELVPGVTGTRAAGKLTVSLDRDRRTVALESAKTEAAALVEAATTEDTGATALEDLAERRQELEGMHADVLTAYAKRLDLGGNGTKAALAERIARAEALTGRRELLTASHLTTDTAVAEHIDDAIASAAAEVVASTPLTGELLAGAADRLGVPLGVRGGHDHRQAEDPADELERNREKHTDAVMADALEAAGNRETLRTVAKARGLSPAGTKTELALRLAQDGATPATVTAATTTTT